MVIVVSRKTAEPISSAISCVAESAGSWLAVVAYITYDYMPRTSPPKPFSIRMSDRTLARLEAGARRRGEPKARTAERLIEEGLRMDDYPGIVFRDGPAGRRPALAGGPDVWEIIETLKGTGAAGEAAIEATAEWGNLTLAQVRLAVRYYGEFSDEIDERILINRREAEHQHAVWERAREALG